VEEKMRADSKKETAIASGPAAAASTVQATQPDRLDELESQSVFILREAFARLKRIAILWSLGKDSNVMIWLARKAFFGHVPCPVMHVDTGKKFSEMYAFRERYAKEWQLNLLVEPCPPIEAVDPTLPPAARKTEGLRRALAAHRFDGLIAGIRRDEEATRAKERVFSPRGADGLWDVRMIWRCACRCKPSTSSTIAASSPVGSRAAICAWMTTFSSCRLASARASSRSRHGRCRKAHRCRAWPAPDNPSASRSIAKS
jgi:hypothetical protein